MDAGADLLVNLSASPFYVDKREFRQPLMAGHAADHGRWLVFVNRVGATDDLVFDGESLVVAPDGEVVRRRRQVFTGTRQFPGMVDPWQVVPGLLFLGLGLALVRKPELGARVDRWQKASGTRRRPDEVEFTENYYWFVRIGGMAFALFGFVVLLDGAL